jgi:cold-inducible RNA-binding protein
VTKKLYVGNLSYDTTEAALNTLFAGIGPVESIAMITDRETGRPKGFAFVEMADDTLAAQAIAQLNGQAVDGRNLTVAEARPKREDSGRSYGGGGGGNGGDRRRRW